jgi:hypothetical protein
MTCCAYSCTQYSLHTQYMLLNSADVLLYLQLHTVRSAYTVHASDPCCWLVWPTVQYISAVFSYLSYKEDPLALFLIVLKSRTNENVYKPEEVNSSAKLLSRKYSCKELLYVPNICIAASYKCIHTYIHTYIHMHICRKKLKQYICNFYRHFGQYICKFLDASRIPEACFADLWLGNTSVRSRIFSDLLVSSLDSHS